jgi:NTP pyrophosphatase (non-canonical NTP hydrolase)
MNILAEELKDFAQMVHSTARAKGFYRVPTHLAVKIALAHSELSEALEWDRDNNPTKVADELADCIIRILDMAEAHRLNVVDAMIKKAEFNRTRPYMHGGKAY